MGTDRTLTKGPRRRLVLRFATGLAAAMLTSILPAAPAVADPLIPSLVVPDWWRNKYQDLYIGFWGPCGYIGYENDCIESIEVAANDGDFQPVRWEPNDAWTPADTRVWWREDRIMGLSSNAAPGSWELPAALAINGNTTLRADIGSGDWAFGFRMEASGGNLPEEWLFRVTVKSRSMQKYMSPFLTGNTKEAKFRILDPNRFQFSARPALAPYPGDAVDCGTLSAGNEVKAERSTSMIRVGWAMDQDGNPNKPGTITLGTNGWYCFGGVEFDNKAREIVARVGTSHYDEKGEVVEGWLEVNIDGDFARAWWNIDPALAANYAKVQIVYRDGTSKAATLTVKYDKADNLVMLRAYGFTYSTPTLRISMAKPVVKAKATTKTKTITCVKGKTVRKFSGANPKCPSGFKRK
jgi:hypothetical protein